MVIAFFGADGRSISAQAALLASVGIGVAAARPVTLVRGIGADDASMPMPDTMPNAIRFVEHSLAAEGHAAVERSLAAARQQGHTVVLDLPGAFLAEPPLGRGSLLSILVVGPAHFDEEAAATMLRRVRPNMVPDADDPCAPWLLGWGRPGGGPAVTAFAHAMAASLAKHGPLMRAASRVRSLPVTLPSLSRTEAAALATGSSTPSLLRSGLLLAAALQAAADAPRAGSLDPLAFATRIGNGDPTPVTRDVRTSTERLRDLADDLQAIHDGVGPSPDELAAAPVLNNWTVEPRMVRALAGHVAGHPDFAPGRLVTTSEVYATDGRSFARTYSRLYRLGTPAGGTPARAH